MCSGFAKLAEIFKHFSNKSMTSVVDRVVALNYYWCVTWIWGPAALIQSRYFPNSSSRSRLTPSHSFDSSSGATSYQVTIARDRMPSYRSYTPRSSSASRSRFMQRPRSTIFWALVRHISYGAEVEMACHWAKSPRLLEEVVLLLDKGSSAVGQDPTQLESCKSQVLVGCAPRFVILCTSERFGLRNSSRFFTCWFFKISIFLAIFLQ